MSAYYFLVLMDFGGFLISLFSLYIVAESTSILLPALRKGIMHLMWGLGIMTLSFAWRLINDFNPGTLYALGDRIMLLIGIGLFFLAVIHLFRMYRIQPEKA